MACNLPNISAYIEAACRDPSLLGNIQYLLEDFVTRLQTESSKNSSSAEHDFQTDTQKDFNQQGNHSDSNPSQENVFNNLMKCAREALENATKLNEGSDNANGPANTQQNENSNHAPEIIIPIRTNNSSDYEFQLNFEGCSSDSIKLDIQEGLLKATAKREEEEGIKTISYEKKLPSNVDVSSLRATFLSNGSLKISGKKSENISNSELKFNHIISK